jgi:hypothetical protein
LIPATGIFMLVAFVPVLLEKEAGDDAVQQASKQG